MTEERICHVEYSENGIPHVAMGEERLVRCMDCRHSRREDAILVCRLRRAMGGVVVPELGFCHEGRAR